jgi:hypothetical protein
LTGVRSGEGKGNDFEDGILVRDLDLDGASVLLRDTKKSHRPHRLSVGTGVGDSHARSEG